MVGKQYTEKELLEALREKAKKNNGKATREDVQSDDDMASSVTYENRFGGWNQALKNANIEINVEMKNNYTNDELIDKLRKARRKYNEPPKITKVRQDGDMPSTHTYKQRFGSWRKAKKVAGIPFGDSFENEVFKFLGVENLEVVKGCDAFRPNDSALVEVKKNLSNRAIRSAVAQMMFTAKKKEMNLNSLKMEVYFETIKNEKSDVRRYKDQFDITTMERVGQNKFEEVRYL